MEPFTLRYSLTRRQRLAVELVPWVPAIAGTIGFTTGAAFLVVTVSPWCFPLLLLPPVMYRSLVAFFFDLVVNGGRPTELSVDETEMELRAGGEVRRLPLDGVFQVFRSGEVWTVLHLDGTVLTIPAGAMTPEQADYLRSFARRLAATRAESPAR